MSQLEGQLAASMRKHLGLTEGSKSYIPFNASLGLAEDPKANNPLLAERWQILSPVRNHEFGPRKSTARFRRSTGAGCSNTQKGEAAQAVRRARDRFLRQGDAGHQLPEDSLSEGRRAWLTLPMAKSVSSCDPKGNGRSDSMKVQFSTQPSSSYYYPRPDVDGQLELAYALTVHKSQGSDFDIVFLILPKAHRRSHGNCFTPA